MASSQVKRQHYVPRTYLKRFASQDGDAYYINALKVSEPKIEGIFPVNIINACLETHLYTLPGENTKERMALETFYSNEFEEHYDRIYDILINPDKTDLNEEERDLIISTLITMFYRTTSWINKHNEFMKRVITQGYELALQMKKNYFIHEGEKISFEGKSLGDLVKEYKMENKPVQVLTQLEVAFSLIETRKANSGIFVIKLNEPECEFITSDDPVIVSSLSPNPSPFDKNNIIKLPIDNKHIVMLMPNSNEAKNLILRHNVSGAICRNKALAININQFKKAERFILGQRSALESFVNSGII